MGTVETISKVGEKEIKVSVRDAPLVPTCYEHYSGLVPLMIEVFRNFRTWSD